VAHGSDTGLHPPQGITGMPGLPDLAGSPRVRDTEHVGEARGQHVRLWGQASPRQTDYQRPGLGASTTDAS
jgi:hypothetical protein